MDKLKEIEDIISGFQKKDIERPEIKKYYIAYFDILGYENELLKYPEKANEMLERLYNGFNYAINRTDNVNTMFPKLLFPTMSYNVIYKIFSDNIALCLDADNITPMALLAFIDQIKELQLYFLNQGFFIRGAITKGDIAINKEFIFGLGLIDAVKKEKEAMFPRIIISDEVINDITKPSQFYPIDRQTLQETKAVLDSDPSNETVGTILDRINKIVKVFNDILWEAPRILDDTSESETLRLALLDAYKKMQTAEDVVSLYNSFIKYAPLILKIGELILAKGENNIIKALQTQFDTLVLTDEANVSFINYLHEPQFNKMFESQDIPKIIQELETTLGIDSKISKEVKSLADDVLIQNQLRQLLSMHRKLVIRNIETYCNLDGIKLDEENEEQKKLINARLSLQKKNEWLRMYHNYNVRKHDFIDLLINCKGERNKATGICVMQNIEQ